MLAAGSADALERAPNECPRDVDLVRRSRKGRGAVEVVARGKEPRNGGYPRERDPNLASAPRSRDADERERPALSVHRLQVHRRVGGRNLEREDELVG